MNSDNSSMDSKKEMPAIRVTAIVESGHTIANLNKPSLMKFPIQTESKSNSLYLNSGINCESDVEFNHFSKKINENSCEDSEFLCLPSSGLVSYIILTYQSLKIHNTDIKIIILLLHYSII